MLNIKLIKAIKKQDVQLVRQLILQGANVNVRDEFGNTPLILSSFSHTNKFPEALTEIAKILINAGADLEAKDELGRTSLIIAAKFNNAVGLEMLIKAGANVNALTNQGETALHDLNVFSVAEHKTKIVLNLLIEAGIDVTAKDKNGITALNKWADYTDSKDLVNTLIKAGADRNDLFTNNGRTELIYACRWNDVEAVKKILSEHPDLEYLKKVDYRDMSALDSAVLSKSWEITDLLINYAKANQTKQSSFSSFIDRKNEEGRPILHYAFDPKVFNALVNAGADINCVSRDNIFLDHNTALFLVIGYGNKEGVELLLNRKISKDVLNDKRPPMLRHPSEGDDTALFNAVYMARQDVSQEHHHDGNTYKDIAILLLKAGADPNVVCQGHKTVSDICDNDEIKKVLNQVKQKKLREENLRSSFSIFANHDPKDISDSEMAKSDFGKGSHTYQRFHR